MNLCGTTSGGLAFSATSLTLLINNLAHGAIGWPHAYLFLTFTNRNLLVEKTIFLWLIYISLMLIGNLHTSPVLLFMLELVLCAVFLF